MDSRKFLKKTPQILLILALALPAFGQAQSAGSLRTWTDKEGRSIQAAWVRTEGDNVVLKLENGNIATVALARFSEADRAFVKELALAKPGAAPQTAVSASSVSGSLTWPESITVDAKSLEIVPGEQNEAARSFAYNSGSFKFVSNAPLTGTVMREIARDFELTRALFLQLPWGWEPRPRNGGPVFQANLYETETDYTAAGGMERTSADSNKDFILTKFATLGLKKVGGKYAYDTKLDKEGDLISMITRLMIGDMRNLLFPWSANGLEEFLRVGAYRNNAYSLVRPHNAIKERIEYLGKSGYTVDVDRMLTFLHSPVNKARGETTTTERVNQYFDGMLLIFFFGYLDEDGKGTRLHEYYRAVCKDALALRAYEDSGRKIPAPFSGTRVDRATALNNIVLRERSDAVLKEEIKAKFKSVGIKM